MFSSTPSPDRTKTQLNLPVEYKSRDQADSAFLRRKLAPEVPVGPDLEIVDLFSGCGGLTIGAIEGA